MSNLCKILIVDDEYILRQGIKHLVDWTKKGFEIVGEASNGKEALELIHEFKPNIVILDVVMPTMDGVELSKVIKKNYPEIQIVILSGHSDFDYVKNTFQIGVNDYILKPKLNPDDFISLLENVAGKIPNFVLPTAKNNTKLNVDNLLAKLISGFDVNLESENIKKIFPHTSYCIIGENIKKLSNISSISTSFINNILLKAARNNLSDVVYYEIHLNSDLFLMLLNFPEENYENVLQKINYMISEIKKEIPKIFFVLSNTFASLHQLKSTYTNNFKPLFDYKFYFKDINLLYYGQLQHNRSKKKFDFKYYSDQIYMLNIDTALKYLKDYIYISIENCSNTEFELKTLLQNALYNFINILDEIDFNVDELQNSKIEYFQMIDETQSSDELLNLFDKITKNINKSIENNQKQMNNQVINRIINYISEHYKEQLHLKQVADKFHFNYYYLSSYFSYHNKEGFSEYVNKIRVEKAVELLMNEKIPVSEISFMVGYSDHSYFCKVFKKFKNITPSKFRRNVISNKVGDTYE
ncbi:response regulator [Clostridium sp. SHJSY1]|uniref:response regulator transcription factor n=1 Tax=Clostridium sp. SHJSY1 TaxID=2942483 RepID=UPI0028764664|nr:response regulator [Clostridium sp. SHJSY1]MDS0527059.1 response regulator [Clostridium sp. SHJSY1]